MRKGTLDVLAYGVIIAVVVLFVGIYTISIVDDIIPDSDMKEYSYTTTTNSTVDFTNSTQNVSHTVTVSSIDTSISDLTGDQTITAIVDNANTTDSYTVTAYLNGASLGSFTASNNTDTSYAFTGVTLTASTANNITYTSDGDAALLYVNSTAVRYPSSTTDTGMGGIRTSLVTSTGTIYDVLVLVIIVVSLGVVLAVLRKGLGSEGSSTAAAV